MDKLFILTNSLISPTDSLDHLADIIEQEQFITDNIYESIKKLNIIKFTKKTYNQIKLHDYSNKKFEMEIRCWNENQETFIHSNPSNGSIVIILDGMLEIIKYTNNPNSIKIINKNKYTTNKTIFLSGSKKELYKIKATANTTSIHIYSPSSETKTIYNNFFN